MASSKFKYYPDRPKKLTVKFAVDEYKKLLNRVSEAESSKSPARWLKLFADWNALSSYIDSEGSRIHYDFSRHMDNHRLEATYKHYREKIEPAAQEYKHKMMQAFLASRYLDALTRQYGKQLVPIYTLELKPLDPINTRLRVKQGQLETQYDKLKGSAKVEVRGEAMTLAKAGSLMQSPDEDLRKEAWLASRGWFLGNRDKLADVYSRLVDLRTKMAANLNYSTFTLLGYEERGRIGYGRPEVEKFRKLVKKLIVPLNRQLASQQANALGKKILKPWDSYDPRTTLPLGIAPVEKQLVTTQKLFNGLSPVLGGYFAELRKKQLIDLESRPAKETNPFCTSFSDSGGVAMLCSSTGNAHDISTLVHESGHAFQGLESTNIDAVDLQWGSMELAEIPSTAMEYLSLPRLEIFFSKQNADKLRLESLEGFVGLLCYACIVDEFQHWVYDNPSVSQDERDKKWSELAHAYSAPIDYEGYEQYQNLRWYAQSHIFGAPFYYIDYALAETAALQIAMIDEKSHKKAMKIYMELCRLGGTKSFLAALKHVGLRSPFDENLIKELATHTKKTLGLV